MSTPHAGRRQVLGRRVEPEPYYVIAEENPQRLVLQSRPETLRGPGMRLFAGGAVLALLGLIFFCSSYWQGTQNVGAAFLGMGLAMLPLFFGGIGLIGGLGVLTTRNRIVIDSQLGQVIYAQSSRVARERTQTIEFAGIRAVRLRRRPFRGPPGSSLPALELLHYDGGIWIVDSSADPAALYPLARQLSQRIAVELQDQLVA